MLSVLSKFFLSISSLSKVLHDLNDLIHNMPSQGKKWTCLHWGPFSWKAYYIRKNTLHSFNKKSPSFLSLVHAPFFFWPMWTVTFFSRPTLLRNWLCTNRTSKCNNISSINYFTFCSLWHLYSMSNFIQLSGFPASSGPFFLKNVKLMVWREEK